MRRLSGLLLLLVLLFQVGIAQDGDPRSDLLLTDSLLPVIAKSDFLRGGLVRGVYIGGHIRQVEEQFGLEHFALQAGYIVKMGDNFLGALDLSIDTENGVAGLGPLVLLPVRERIWIVAGAEVVNLALRDTGITNNRTASLKGGFVVLIQDKPIWGNAYLAVSALYFSRMPAGRGEYLMTGSIVVEKEAAIETGLWLGINVFFD